MLKSEGACSVIQACSEVDLRCYDSNNCLSVRTLKDAAPIYLDVNLRKIGKENVRISQIASLECSRSGLLLSKEIEEGN
jgi:hypothetical protein